jgi:energy-coupling factor transporter ATP-binding protein EcfA2
MLTRLVVRNFKTLEDVDIELGQNVVFIGPNNSGKTSALQALALWQTGVRTWRLSPSDPQSKDLSWATINRRSLTHTPVREVGLLWRNKLRMTQYRRQDDAFADMIPIQVLVEGQGGNGAWQFGVELFLSNPESLLCRPMRGDSLGASLPGLEIPEPVHWVKIAFLPPMSGLAAEEEELQPGRVDVLIGEGQTARVLRNLCLVVLERSSQDWEAIAERLRQMFGVRVGLPQRDPARGTVELSYREGDLELDIASAGRGLQQTLLLLAHMHANPGATLLLDEPDAHLEVLRQRQIYNVLTDTARASGSQIIMASHSEIILDEAADRDVVVAFVGKPHRINNQAAQLKKALTEIGFEQYAQALLRPGVLYLEGATDLAMLRAFAERLQHPARDVLREPFAHYIGNQPRLASAHYYGLREAKPELRAFALFDRRETGLPTEFTIQAHCWRKREIENYVSRRSVLLGFASGDPPIDLLAQAEADRRREAMEAALAEVEAAQQTLFGRDAWGDDVKASEEVLPAVFRLFYKSIGLRNEMNKADYHELVAYLEPAEIDPEVTGVLDRIDAVLRELP